MYRLLFLLLLPISLAAQAAPKVVASIMPIYSLTCAVMENVSEPELLISAKMSPHTYAARPSDIRKLTLADLVIWVGEDLESNLHNIIFKKVSNAKQLHLMREDSINLLSNACLCKDHDHDQYDPHIWLSIDNAIAITKIIANRLSAIDPENANIYIKNATRHIEKLKSLNIKIKSKLAGVSHVPYMVMHPGYAYFEKDMRLNNLGAIVENSHAPASLKIIKEKKNMIIAKHIKCIFAESQIPSDLAYKLAHEARITTGTLDPFGRELIDLKAQAYYTMINNLAESFKRCLTNQK